MLNFTKLNNALTGIITQSESATTEDVKKLKDIQLAQLFISTENIINALEDLTAKIDSEIATRGEILIPETSQMITIETESVIKLKKMTKKELKALEKKNEEKAAAPKKVIKTAEKKNEAKAETPKKASAKKKAAPKKAKTEK